MKIDFSKKRVIFIYLLLLAAAFLLMKHIFETTLITDDIFAEGLRSKFSKAFVEKQLESRHRPVKAYYFTEPLMVFVKISLISLLLMFGKFIVNIKELNFWKIFSAAALAESVFLFSEVIKTIWFLYFNTQYGLLEVVNFRPLSVISIFDIEHLEFWENFLFARAGVFPVLYMFVLAWLFNRVYRIDFNQATQVVIYSVGISYLLYLIGGTLIYMNY